MYGFFIGIWYPWFNSSECKNQWSARYETRRKEKCHIEEVPNKNWSEVANLWRDRRNGSFIFQVENEFYKQGNDLSAKERKLLLKVIMDFYRWLEPPTTLPAKSEELIEPALSEENTPKNTVKTEVPNVSLMNTPVQVEQLNDQKGGLSAANIISRALRSDVKVSTLPTQSMVTQVDEILQEKLIAANMQKWAVRLAEFPNKGMIVLVGLEKYEGIDDVPYERVRVIIRESVSEWERRAENGKLAQ